MKPRVKEIDVGKVPAADLLPEAHERLAVAQAELNSAAAKYGDTASPRDGVTMRGARARLSSIEDELAELEDRATCEKREADAAARKEAREKIANLTTKREALAAQVDSQIEELTKTIQAWMDVDDDIYVAWHGPKGNIPVLLGRSRVLGLVRETMARVSAGILSSDISPSQADQMRTAVSVARDDSRQLTGAL